MTVILILLVCLFFFVCHHVCLSKLNKFDIRATLALKKASDDIQSATLALEKTSDCIQIEVLKAKILRLIEAKDNLDKSQDKERLKIMFLWLGSFLLSILVPCICNFWACVWPLLFLPILYFMIDSVVGSIRNFKFRKQFGQPPPWVCCPFFLNYIF